MDNREKLGQLADDLGADFVIDRMIRWFDDDNDLAPLVRDIEVSVFGGSYVYGD
jgi:hypothetical protein